MRRTESQRQSIKSAVAAVIGEESRVWLFGSRVDDAKRGGDIDLLIETDKVVAGRISALCRIEGALVVRLGNRRIDLLLKDAQTAEAPIFDVARRTGVLL